MPAVWVPPSSTGESPARASSVVSRNPWSVSTSRVSPVGDPPSSSTGASTAKISRANRPSSTATRAFCCDARPKASTDSLLKPRSRAIRSAPSNWFGRSMSQAGGRGSPRPSGTLPPSGIRDIDSTPQATPVRITPARIIALTRWVACCPDEHWASITVEATSFGNPACIHARRTMLFDCSPAWVTQPPITSSTSDGSTPERLSTSTWAAPSRSAACTPASQPRRLPSGVRTASTITGLPAEFRMTQN